MDKYLQPENTPVTQDRPTSGFEFDSGYEVQSRRGVVSNLSVRGGELQISGGGILTIKDVQGDDVLTYNADTNTTEFIANVAGLVQETRFEFNAIDKFTGNESYEFSGPAANQYPIIQIDSTGWGTNTLWYFDVVANGDSPLPLIYHLVDLTNGTVEVTNTVGTSGTTSTATFNRVGPFTLSSGTIQYGYQHKKGGTAVVYPAVVSAAMVAHHL